jgi:hypothetical protein
MFLFNKFSRLQASKSAVISLFENQEDDAATALLKLTLEPSVSALGSNSTSIEYTDSFAAIDPIVIKTATAVSPPVMPNDALMIYFEEPKPSNAVDQSYSVIEGPPIAGPFVEPQDGIGALETVDGSEGNDVFGYPAPAGTGTLGTIDGSEGNDVFGNPVSAGFPASPEQTATNPVICWEGSYDPLLTVRQEYAAAITNRSVAAMELFLARHPGVEVSAEAGVIKYNLLVATPNGQSEWIVLS